MVFFYGRKHSCTRKQNGSEEKKLFFEKKAIAGLFYINIYWCSPLLINSSIKETKTATDIPHTSIRRNRSSITWKPSSYITLVLYRICFKIHQIASWDLETFSNLLCTHLACVELDASGNQGYKCINEIYQVTLTSSVS